MIKGKKNGKWSCITKSGNSKKRWDTDKRAISAAKFSNINFPKIGTKLVPYKCAFCFKYHLTTVKYAKRKRFI